MCQLDKPLMDTSVESLTQVLTSQRRYIIDKRNELKHSHYEDGDDNNKDCFQSLPINM